MLSNYRGYLSCVGIMVGIMSVNDFLFRFIDSLTLSDSGRYIYNKTAQIYVVDQVLAPAGFEALLFMNLSLTVSFKNNTLNLTGSTNRSTGRLAWLRHTKVNPGVARSGLGLPEVVDYLLHCLSLTLEHSNRPVQRKR